ncbi:MAG TPA: hypothetical protein DC054_08135 [Blastocatellia bacterium]|nr:hypothetical protein [Blastocatellia bacterium]
MELNNRTSEQDSILNLTRSAGLIFSGTVVKLGESTVPSVAPRDDLVVIKVDRGLRVDPVLGDLRGRMITMATSSPGSLSPGERAVFFTRSWIHGGGIAVIEVAHLDLQAEDEVASAVDLLPDMHLTDRLLSADLVVVGEVTEVEQLPRMTYERDAALWAAAHLRVDRVLLGEPRDPVIVHFPTSVGPPWFKAPRFKVGQRGVFVLHERSSDGTWSEKSLEAGSLTALDPSDFLPEEKLPQVEKVMATLDREGGPR